MEGEFKDGRDFGIAAVPKSVQIGPQ